MGNPIWRGNSSATVERDKGREERMRNLPAGREGFWRHCCRPIETRRLWIPREDKERSLLALERDKRKISKQERDLLTGVWEPEPGNGGFRHREGDWCRPIKARCPWNMREDWERSLLTLVRDKRKTSKGGNRFSDQSGGIETGKRWIDVRQWKNYANGEGERVDYRP